MEKSNYLTRNSFKGAIAAVAVAVLTATPASAGASADAIQSYAKDMLCKLYLALGTVTGLIASLVVVGAGVRWVMSQNDPGQRKLAKDIILGVLLGLSLIVIAGALVEALMGYTVTMDC